MNDIYLKEDEPLLLYERNLTSLDEFEMISPIWEEWTTNEFLTEEEVILLRSFDFNTNNWNINMNFIDHASTFGQISRKILEKNLDTDVLDCLLFMIERTLVSTSNMILVANLMFQVHTSENQSQEKNSSNSGLFLDLSFFSILFKSVTHTVRNRSLYICSLLLSLTKDNHLDLLKSVIGELIYDLTQYDDRKQPSFSLISAIQSLGVILRNNFAREEFALHDGMHLLSNFLTHMEDFEKINNTLQYDLMYCIWLACFSEKITNKVDKSFFHLLIVAIRSDVKHSVARLGVGVVRLILMHIQPDDPRKCYEQLNELNLLKIIEDFLEKKSFQEDPELIEDLKWIQTVLLENYRIFTSFERHQKELLSGELHHNLTHEEAFWKENARKFEENNFFSIKLLVDLLDSTNPSTVALACNDIGFFVQYYPHGNLIIDKYDGKNKIISLLLSQNQNIKKKALLACSKIMITNWEEI